MRYGEIKRKTAETDIILELNLDSKGESSIDTGCGFFDHMLTLFAKYGRFDLEVKCIGDIEVDYHHTTEDIGIVLGSAFKEALGDKKGITRYGDTTLPMDESLILTAVDKVCLNYNTDKQVELDTINIDEAKKYIDENQFAKGSMLPKIEACISFVENSDNKKAIISSLDKASDAINGKNGTIIKRR